MLNCKKENPKDIIAFVRSVKHNANCLDLIMEIERQRQIRAENSYLNQNSPERAICQELKDIKQKAFVEEKNRQLLHQNSHELRLLENQLRCALVLKDLDNQRQAGATSKALQLQEKEEEDKLWKLECARALESLKHEEEIRKQKKQEFMRAIQEQMRHTEIRRLEERQQVLNDREKMQKWLELVRAEDMQRKVELKRMRLAEKKAWEEVLRLKEEQKLLEKQQNMYNRRKDIEYQEEKDKLNEKLIQERNKILSERAALSERLGRQLEELQNEQMKRDNILMSLLIEERKAKDDDRYRESLLKQIEISKNIQLDMDIYNKCIKPAREAQIREMENGIMENREKLLEDYEKATQDSLKARRQKIEQNAKIIETIIEQRRHEKSKEAAEKIKEYEMLLAFQRDKDEQIERERVKLLEAQPPEILRYLPRGVLRSTDNHILSNINKQNKTNPLA